MNNKPQQMGVPIGTSLLLVVFVLLALITFATLSYVSADTDNKLSQNVADATTQFYTTDSGAQVTLADIHDTLLSTATLEGDELYKALQTKLSEHTIEQRDGKIFISYETVLDEQESLFCEIEVLSGGDYNITRWQLLYTEEWNSSTEFPVFQ